MKEEIKNKIDKIISENHSPTEKNNFLPKANNSSPADTSNSEKEMDNSELPVTICPLKKEVEK